MAIEWQNNSANVGRLELRVRRSDFTGKWNTLVFLGLNQIGSHHEFDSDAEARAWCEREALSIVGPLLDTARAEGATAEREACIALLERRIASHTDAINDIIRDGFPADAYRTARAALRLVCAEIRDRSNGGAQ